MKRPFNTEREALANSRRINVRVGDGPTRQVAYPCPDCTENMGPETWHLRTERPIEGKLLKLERKRGTRRRRPSPRAWENEDYEGKWAA
jgi:hypothetical protein